MQDGSITELLAWFGAYKPQYIGWSTNCDGVEYAKEDMIFNDGDRVNINLALYGSDKVGLDQR
ncbi:MAG: hypothetical protein JWR34_183 [Mycobacterium sp.]|nr:hypothetical protein [Mycobacterium sp.]